MSRPLIKLYAAFGAFFGNLVAIPLFGMYAKHLVGYSMFTLFVVCLPLYVLCSKDALNHISRSLTISTSSKAFAWLVACLPTVLFGLLAIAFGATIIVWVLYNFLVERQPEFSGPMVFGGFGVGPAMLLFGIYSLRSLWVRRAKS